MTIKDKNIGYKFAFETINAMDFGFDALSGEGFATSGCVYEEVGSTGIGGFTFALSGQVCRYVMPRPSHWDIDNDIFVRVIFATGSTIPADTLTWSVLHAGQAFGSSVGVPAGVLDTAITQSSNDPDANALQATAGGKINAGTFTTSHDFLVFDVELDAFDAGLAESKQMVALEFAYTPKLTKLPQQAPDLQAADPWS